MRVRCRVTVIRLNALKTKKIILDLQYIAKVHAAAAYTDVIYCTMGTLAGLDLCAYGKFSVT